MSRDNIFQRAHTESLYNDLRRGNTEQAKKERFLQYLTTSFASDSGAQKLISAIALGAERIIANITRGERLAKGRAVSTPTSFSGMRSRSLIGTFEASGSATRHPSTEKQRQHYGRRQRAKAQFRFVDTGEFCPGIFGDIRHLSQKLSRRGNHDWWGAH